MSYTDIHFHLLPGVDDGPQTIEESIELAATAFAEGTRTIVATPHIRSDFFTAVEELPERVREVEDRLSREGIGMTILRGGELGHDMVGRLGQPELELIAQGPPGGRWLLVGMEAQAVARRVVREGRAQVVASDAHGGRRQPALLLGRDAAAFAEVSRRDADCLIRSNPRRLLERGLAVPRHVAVL
jgi:tyrosine-protein phosphatase YwqE